MRIMTHRTGRVIVHDVQCMLRKRRAGQDGAPLVAPVTQRIALGGLDRPIGRVIARDKNRRGIRSVRAIGPVAPGQLTGVGVMTVGTVNHARNSQRGNEAGHVGVFAGDFDGMIRDRGRGKLKPLVQLRDDARDGFDGAGRLIGVTFEADLILKLRVGDGVPRRVHTSDFSEFP